MAINPTIGTPASITVTGLSTLTSGNYVESNPYTFNSTTRPIDAVLQVEAATTNTPTGNKQLLVFAKASLDGSNYRSGPSSGSSTTDESDMVYLGAVPINSSSATHRIMFPLARVLGYIPVSAKFVFRNDLGVTLTSAAVSIAEITA